MSSPDGVDPNVKEILRIASGLLQVQAGDRLWIQFVVRADGTPQISLPADPRHEGEVWKFMAYLPDMIKKFYMEKNQLVVPR
jgi:hypothetical protein